MNNDTLQHEFDRFLSTLDEIKKLSNELDKQIKHYPYLQPFNQSTNQPINDICSYTKEQTWLKRL